MEPNETPPTISPLPPPPPREPTFGDKLKKYLGPVGVVLFLILKFLAKFKFVLPFLKTGGMMILSIGAYALMWPWQFAIGFVLLIFIHECGHLIVARQLGLRASWPVLVPFLGGFTLMKDLPPNARIEAEVAFGGPLLGAMAAAICELIYLGTGNKLFRALAYSGFFLNLLNLAPVGFLDGGRIVTALSPMLWIVGFLIMLVLTITNFNLILVLILVTSLPRLFSLFRAKTEEEKRYFEVTPQQRLIVALTYFGLIAFLVFGMQLTHIPPDSLR